MSFKATISPEHREMVERLLEQRCVALQAHAEQPSAELIALRSRSAELAGEVARLEGGADLQNVEAAAATLVHRRTEKELLDRQIGRLEAALSEATRKADAEGGRWAVQAADVLAAVALDFIEQHRRHVAGLLEPYTTGHAASGRNALRLLPFFTDYSRRATALRARHLTVSAATILSWLAAALEGEDFLMVSQA